MSILTSGPSTCQQRFNNMNIYWTGLELDNHQSSPQFEDCLRRTWDSLPHTVSGASMLDRGTWAWCRGQSTGHWTGSPQRADSRRSCTYWGTWSTLVQYTAVQQISTQQNSYLQYAVVHLYSTLQWSCTVYCSTAKQYSAKQLSTVHCSTLVLDGLPGRVSGGGQLQAVPVLEEIVTWESRYQ